METGTKWLMEGAGGMQHKHSAETLDQGDDSCLKQDRAGQYKISSCYSEQKAIKTYKVFISGIFHIIFSNCYWL